MTDSPARHDDPCRGSVLLPLAAVLGVTGLATSLLLLHRHALVSQLNVRGHEHAAHVWVGEQGPVEWLQLAFVALLVLQLQGALLAWRGRAVGWLVVPLALFVLVREADWILEGHLGRHAHRPLMVALAVLTGVLAWWHRVRLLASMSLLRGAFAGLLAGALTLLAAAQVLGHPEAWNALAREGEAVRVAKRFVEEGLEGLSYLFALVASQLLWAPTPAPSAARPPRVAASPGRP